MSTVATPGRGAHITLATLLLVFVFSHIDRNILNILVEPIKEDLGVSDTAMGWLTGPAFAVFYATLAIPVARYADRASRKVIIVVGLLLWSVVTAAQGLVRVFSHLVVARIFVGIGEATTSPASQSMISDYYPPERRAVPLSIFAAGGHIGMMAGYMFGGIMNEWMGWRMAFVAVGLPGLLVAVIFWFTVREPTRGQSEGIADEEQLSFREVLGYLARRPAFRHLNYSAVLYVATIYGFNVWGPTFLMRVHDLSTSEAGLTFGPVTGIAGFLGTLASGALADKMTARDVRWAMWIPAAGAVLSIPFCVGFLFAPNPQLALVFYGAQVFLATFWMGPSFWACQGLAKLRMRAMASALLLMNINLLGMGLGPLLIGVLNDALRSGFGEAGIRYSLLVLCVPMLWAAMHSLAVNRTLERDLALAKASGAGDD
jgi:predicted MFS family arabinose efflux permease